MPQTLVKLTAVSLSLAALLLQLGEPVQAQTTAPAQAQKSQAAKLLGTAVVTTNATVITSAEANVSAPIQTPNPQAAKLLSPAVITAETTAQAEPDKPLPRAKRSYIGVGGGIGVDGSETGLSDGGFAILSRIGLTDNLSIHNATVFGDDRALMPALTVGVPIRNRTTSSVVAFPFIGGGVNINTSDDFQVDPLLVTGVDIPVSSRFTVTGRVNVSFGEEDTDVGLLLGVGYSFGRVPDR